MRGRLAQFPPVAREDASALITARVMALPEFQQVHVVALYAALPVEPQTRGIFAGAQAGQILVFPRMDAATSRLDFFAVHDWNELVPGKFGLLEPDPHKCELMELAAIDTILVPGMAFDRHCLRLGRGGGYYDRLLERLPQATRRVGAFFACQEVESVLSEAHDQPLDAIVTEKGVIENAKQD